MKRYVVGFPILPDRTGMSLIKKNRPEWQAGKWNGIDGKVEALERPHDAMIREAEEEAGLGDLPWGHVCRITDVAHLYEVDFYATFHLRAHGVKSKTDEQVEFFPMHMVYDLKMVSSNVLVALTLALDTSGIVKPVMLHAHWLPGGN